MGKLGIYTRASLSKERQLKPEAQSHRKETHASVVTRQQVEKEAILGSALGKSNLRKEVRRKTTTTTKST